MNTIEHGSKVIATANIWHNLVKEGAKGIVCKVMDSGCNVFFPLSHQYSYQDQIFFCEYNQIKPL